MGVGSSRKCSGCGLGLLADDELGEEAPVRWWENEPSAGAAQQPAVNRASFSSGSPPSPGGGEGGYDSSAACSANVAPNASRWVLPRERQLTVMMFGMTGSGKSSLGNLLAGSKVFEASDDTASVTNTHSLMRYEVPDGSMILLDTIGLGDTEISDEAVVSSIRDTALSAPFGIDVVLFVLRLGRITDETVARLAFVTEYLWGTECLPNFYIAITGAPRFVKGTEEEAHEWIERQAEINWRFQHMFELASKDPNRIVFVDNPDPASQEPFWEERRFASREGVMQLLVKHPRDQTPPFTHKMMRSAQVFSQAEREELEKRRKDVQDLDNVEASMKPEDSESTTPSVTPTTSLRPGAQAVEKTSSRRPETNTKNKSKQNEKKEDEANSKPPPQEAAEKTSPRRPEADTRNTSKNNEKKEDEANSEPPPKEEIATGTSEKVAAAISSEGQSLANNKRIRKRRDLSDKERQFASTLKELMELRAAAIERRGAAERKLQEKLQQLKDDPSFQEQVDREIDSATSRFAADIQDSESASVDSKALAASWRKVSLRANAMEACKLLLDSMYRKLRQGKVGTKPEALASSGTLPGTISPLLQLSPRLDDPVAAPERPKPASGLATTAEQAKPKGSRVGRPGAKASPQKKPTQAAAQR